MSMLRLVVLIILQGAEKVGTSEDEYTTQGKNTRELVVYSG